MRAQFRVRRPMYMVSPIPHDRRESGGCGDEYGPGGLPRRRDLRRHQGARPHALDQASEPSRSRLRRQALRRHGLRTRRARRRAGAPLFCARISASRPSRARITLPTWRTGSSYCGRTSARSSPPHPMPSARWISSTVCPRVRQRPCGPGATPRRPRRKARSPSPRRLRNPPRLWTRDEATSGSGDWNAGSKKGRGIATGRPRRRRFAAPIARCFATSETVDAGGRAVPLGAASCRENPLNYCDFMRPTRRIPYPPPLNFSER